MSQEFIRLTEGTIISSWQAVTSAGQKIELAVEQTYWSRMQARISWRLIPSSAPCASGAALIQEARDERESGRGRVRSGSPARLPARLPPDAP
jgi:hypothetical protein